MSQMEGVVEARPSAQQGRAGGPAIPAEVVSAAALPTPQAIAALEAILARPGDDSRDSKEAAIYKLADLYAAVGNADALADLLKRVRPFFQLIAKARTAKIVRMLLDKVGTIAGSEARQIALCTESIEWAKETNRSYLRQRLQLKLNSLYLQTSDYGKALGGVTALLREVKRLDDKPLLLELHLLESRVHRAMRNIARAKAALTGARACANAIYCPPMQQAELDLQSGVVSADERDFRTAHSYLFEAFEAYQQITPANANASDPTYRLAAAALKYMLLTKIMSNNPDEVAGIVSGKSAQRFVEEPEIKAMCEIARAHKERNVHALRDLRVKYYKQIVEDSVVGKHLDELNDKLLEQNLCRIIEPYSRVEIDHVASLIKLPRDDVETRLSLMILDKKIEGILDQGAGTLVLFDDPPNDKTYPLSLDTIQNLNHVVDSLFERATKLLS
eukprot:m51a1_g5944 hypothetical protein (446) ;mRNA; r:122127-123926